MHKPINVFFLMILAPVAFGDDQCMGDHYSGSDSLAYRDAFKVLSLKSEGAEIKEKKRQAMAVIHAEAARGNFFASIFENAIFQSKGMDRKSAVDHMPIMVRQNGKCDGVTYAFSLSAIPSYLGSRTQNGYWAYPNLATWMRSGDPYNLKEAARWLVGLNATYGSDIWGEAFTNIYRLGKCENVDGAIADADKIYKSASQEWRARFDEARVRVDQACLSRIPAG